MTRRSGITLIATVALAVPAAFTSARQPPGAAASRVPLKEGLTIVTALNQPEYGDYESLKTIVKATDKLVRLRYAAEVPATDGGTGKARQLHTYRTVNRSDLESATDYRLMFSDAQPELFPGSTAVGVSRRVLLDLKSKGSSLLSVPLGGVEGGLASLLGSVLGGAAKDLGIATMRKGTLKRVEAQAVPFKVLLNDQPVELPAIHARGTLGDDDAEFWLLDDPDNPIALKWEIGDDRLQVIRLSYPVTPATDPPGGPPMKADPKTSAGGGVGAGAGGAGGAAAANSAAGTAKRIEEDITKTGRAVVYGIYFDFASDRIKEESEPVLAEIAQVLRQNPAWNLALEGHTDSIGGDSYNLDLSKRRSASVKQALTTRYQIDPKRLGASGYGASRPKDRNDTLEGRARNRRVELVKSN
ncbi:MAG: OmpA family protein [Vicinamibacterales bacterium]